MFPAFYDAMCKEMVILRIMEVFMPFSEMMRCVID